MAIDGKAMSFAQKAKHHKVDKHQTFAVGMGEEEATGEEISLKDREVVTIRKNLTPDSKKFGAEDLGVRFFAKAKKWAVGLDGPIGESSQLRDADVVTMVDPKKIKMDPKSDVHGATPLTVKYLAKGNTKMNLKGQKQKFAEGLNGPIGDSSQLRDADVVTMVDPKKITMDPKSNEHGAVPLTVKYLAKKASKADAFEAQKNKFKNLAQTSRVIKVGGAEPAGEAAASFELAGDKGPGMPTLDGKVQGEKQWQGWAQDHVDWLDNQTAKANARPPYNSTLLQFDLAGNHGPGMPELTGNVRGEKEWQGWAQDHVDWLDKQEDAAQARPPYNSTLVQTGAVDWDLAGPDGPGMPNLSGVVQGEKQWQQWAQDHVDWLDKQADIAQTRLPYVSTLVQLDNKREMTDDQAIAAVDNILMDKAESNKLPEKVEYDMPNSELTQLKAINDDPQQLEGFIMEDNGIPLNMRLVQTKSDDDMEYMTMNDVPFNARLAQTKADDDMEYMTMDDVPFNAKLVHIGNPEEGELVMLDQGQKWGFLKNIVNIDRFFDSGVRA